MAVESGAPRPERGGGKKARGPPWDTRGVVDQKSGPQGARDTDSRAPLASMERFKTRMGWAVPWYSSYGGDFNYDFHVSFDERRAPLEYNYKDKEALERETPYIRSGADGPGVSVFVRDRDQIFHTYSAYERGLDTLLGTYRWLELTPLGRQRHVIEFPYHDTYAQEPR